MNSNDSRNRLEDRLETLLDRLDRMAASQQQLQEENAQLRAIIERSTADRHNGRADTVPPQRDERVRVPQTDVASSWLNQPQPSDTPRETWTGHVTPGAAAPSADARMARWSESNDVLETAPPFVHNPRHAAPMRAPATNGELRAQPAPATAPAALTPATSTRFGRGLDPEEFDRVEPPVSQRVPRRDVDLGYVNSVEAEELDKLPYGLIILDLNGKILFYNETESKYAGYAPERVIGRSFFNEVAPCTRVKEFEGRFRDFVAGRLGRVHFFDFVFNFADGAQTVLIGLSPGRQRGQVNVMLTRR